MKTVEEIEANYRKDLAKLELEKAVRLSVPEPVTSIVCVHRDHTSVCYDKRPPHHYSIKEAFEIYEKYLPFIVDGEAWRGGCLSSQPPEINSCAKKELAKFLHVAHVMITMHGGEKFQLFRLEFFARIEGRLLGVNIHINLPHQWMPTFYWSPGGHGTRGGWIKRNASIPHTKLINFSYGDDAYNYQHSWPDTDSFRLAIQPYLEEKQDVKAS